jgi:two-component system response regulator LytT
MENKIKILIVEDEALIAQNLKQTLEDFNFEVVAVCYQYDTAIIEIANKEFDLAILDINLGSHQSKTGLDIATKLKEIKQVPFIFLTAFSDIDTVSKAALLSPSAYLVKPNNGPTIFASIQTAIANFANNTTAKMPGEKSEDEDYFFTKVGNRLKKVYWTDIQVVSSIKNYVKLVSENNAAGYLMRSSLQNFLTTILPKRFSHLFIHINRQTAIQKEIIIECHDDIIVTMHGQFESTKSVIAELMK